MLRSRCAPAHRFPVSHRFMQPNGIPVAFIEACQSYLFSEHSRPETGQHIGNTCTHIFYGPVGRKHGRKKIFLECFSMVFHLIRALLPCDRRFSTRLGDRDREWRMCVCARAPCVAYLLGKQIKHMLTSMLNVDSIGRHSQNSTTNKESQQRERKKE